jgi:phosphoglycolate phosphatase
MSALRIRLALLATVLGACAAPAIEPGRWIEVRDQPVEAMGAHESCVTMQPGDRLEYRFRARRPVSFDIRRRGTRRRRVRPAQRAGVLPHVARRTGRHADRLRRTHASRWRAPMSVPARAAGVLLLDLDGTLSDNYAGISNSIRHALAKLGAAAPDDDELRRCIGPPLRESFARLLGRSDAAAIEAAIDAYRERYQDLGWQENVAYPGVGAALEALSAKRVRMFVCTSKPERYATRIVRHFGFDAHVERVFGADLAGALDDKRKLLAHLIARESLVPGKCVMVGDRIHDVRAAHANGTRAVGVLWGYGDAAELAQAERLLEAPRELVTLAEPCTGS